MKISADVLKAALPPLRYYTAVLSSMPTTRREGWVSGGLCPFHNDTKATSESARRAPAALPAGPKAGISLLFIGPSTT